MPIKKSAQKALRQTIKRTLVNQAAKAKIKTLEKKFKSLVSQKNKTEAKVLFSKLVQAVDKAVKNNILSPNNAGRAKSQFQKVLNKVA